MDGEVKRYGGDDFPLPEEALADIAEVKQRLEEMAARVPLDKPWLAEDAGAWDAQSVAGWLSSNAKTRVIFTSP